MGQSRRRIAKRQRGAPSRLKRYVASFAEVDKDIPSHKLRESHLSVVVVVGRLAGAPIDTAFCNDGDWPNPYLEKELAEEDALVNHAEHPEERS